jgi:hypothetical protein
MAIVQTNDFVSEYKVSTSRFTDLDKYITKYEKYYLLRLLGADTYALFIADLTIPTPQVPQTQRFIDIFNPFNTIPSLTPSLYISEGIKKMLVMFIYFHYVRDSSNYNTISGQVINNNENSTNISTGFNIVDAYNTAVDTYINIQEYLQQDTTTYPEYQDSYSELICYASGI